MQDNMHSSAATLEEQITERFGLLLTQTQLATQSESIGLLSEPASCRTDARALHTLICRYGYRFLEGSLGRSRQG